MDELLEQNPGLSSRFPHSLTFVDYEVAELSDIGLCVLRDRQFKLCPQALPAFHEALEGEDTSSNARSVRNFCESLLRLQSLRLAERLSSDSEVMEADDLALVTEEDVRAHMEQARRLKALQPPPRPALGFA